MHTIGRTERGREGGRERGRERVREGNVDALISLSLLLRAASLGVGYSTRSSGTMNWGKADSTSAWWWSGQKGGKRGD